MNNWEQKCEFSQEKEMFNPITSVSVSALGDVVVAGSLMGQVFVFEKRISAGCWDHVYTWGANVKTIDVKLQKEVNPIVIDTELFPSKRKNPLLLTAGQQDIHIWFLSDKYEPIMPKNFVPNGVSFPVSERRERFIKENDVLRIRAGEGNSITSVRACTDGLSFAFSEEKMVKIGRMDHLEHFSTIFSGEQNITRVDFNPTSYDILLAADEKGICNVIDSRIAPKATTPSMKAFCTNNLLGKMNFISECRFSSNGQTFFTRHPGDIIFWDMRNIKEPLSVISLVTDAQRNYLDGREQWRCTWYDENIVVTGSLGGEIKLVSSSQVLDTAQTSSRGAFFWLKDKKHWEKKHSVYSVDISPSKVAAVSNGSKLFIYDCKS